MKLYNIQQDDSNWGKLYNEEINASHIWNMPGVKCSTCGQTWAMIGVSYPLVDLSTISSSSQFLEPWPVPIETYKKLRDLIINLVPKGLPIPPGTKFGSLVGEAKGRFGDLAWVKPWTFLIRREVYTKLTSSNLHLPDVAIPRLQFENGNYCELLEFQIEPSLYLSSASYSLPEAQPCPQCGRDSRKVEQLVVDEKSIPSNLDMFRIINFPTKIIVTERFKDKVSQLNLTNILFSNVDIG